MANKTKVELINEIKDLQNLVDSMCIAARDFRKEIKDLRDAATADAFEIRELRNEIRDLQDVVIALRNDCNNLTAEKHEKANKVKELEQVLKTAVDMRDFWLEEKDSEISKLDKAVAQLAAVIGEKDKKIRDLKVALASAEKLNDARKFYNATEALGNPLHFQGVSND